MYQTPTQTRPPVAQVGAAQPPAPEIPLPPEPGSIDQTGLTLGFLSDLALKTLYLRGQMTMAEIASSLGLPIVNVTDRVMEFLKSERLVEIRGGGGLLFAKYHVVLIHRGSGKVLVATAGGPSVVECPGAVPLFTHVVPLQ